MSENGWANDSSDCFSSEHLLGDEFTRTSDGLSSRAFASRDVPSDITHDSRPATRPSMRGQTRGNRDGESETCGMFAPKKYSRSEFLPTRRNPPEVKKIYGKRTLEMSKKTSTQIKTRSESIKTHFKPYPERSSSDREIEIISSEDDETSGTGLGSLEDLAKVKKIQKPLSMLEPNGILQCVMYGTHELFSSKNACDNFSSFRVVKDAIFLRFPNEDSILLKCVFDWAHNLNHTLDQTLLNLSLVAILF